MKPSCQTIRSLAVTLGLATAIAPLPASEGVGAGMPWKSYEAEAMRTKGTVLGPGYAPHTIETESSAQRCVRLGAPGEFVEFAAPIAAQALVVRFSLPDAPEGGGTNSTLALLINGRPARTLALSSRYAWLYGQYPFSNDPKQGKPRNFYDEIRVMDLTIAEGDVIRLTKNTTDGVPCTIDLIDLEPVPAPLAAPERALSVLEFGADGHGTADDTEALRRCIEAARERGRPVWVPPGDYQISGDIIVPSGVTIQGAGMWHTTFVGDEDRYGQAERRVRFKLAGSDIRLADFAIFGRLNYRNDDEPNDGIVGAGCRDSSVTRVWVEHTKAGAWIYNGSRLRIEGCRFRNLIADGINLCVGTHDTVVENCSARGTGDDCFAIWPAASDQGYVGQRPPPGGNVIRRCTGQLTFLANGVALYGGANNRIEDCLFTDIGTGCGILISTSFSTADAERGIDNNFSGTTVVGNCRLARCGGWDHDWGWRGSLQICLHRRSISGLAIRHVDIVDSISDGLTVVAPGRPQGQGTLAQTRLDAVRVTGFGLGDTSRHGLWIREDAAGSMELVDSRIGDIRNDSPAFSLRRE